jgi:hypothetical protein
MINFMLKFGKGVLEQGLKFLDSVNPFSSLSYSSFRLIPESIPNSRLGQDKPRTRGCCTTQSTTAGGSIHCLGFVDGRDDPVPKVETRVEKCETPNIQSQDCQSSAFCSC